MTEVIVLTPEQIEIDNYRAGPLRIIAGAGSGKTEMMVTLVARLVSQGLASPGEVLVLTFTERAAAELQGRIAARLGPGTGVRAGTFHAFCADLLGEYALSAGLDRDFRVLMRPALWQMMFEIFDDFTFEHVRLGLGVGNFVDQMVALDAGMKDNLITPDQLARYCTEGLNSERYLDDRARQTMAEQLETIPVIARYSERKRELNVVDYGDMIGHIIEMVRQNASVRLAVQERYRYVLVDEFQDTNVAQKELIRLIASPQNNLVVVGDPNQAIYTWRGATISNILNFDQEYEDAVTRTLSVNFRCARSIRTIADAIVAPLADAYDWEFRSSSPMSMEDGAVEAFVTAFGDDEAQEIADRIARLQVCGTPYQEIAILYRSRKQRGAIVAALTKNDIPFEVVGGGEFYSRPEIVDALCTLRLIARPGDDIALYRLLIGPRWRIGERDLACMARWRGRVVGRRGIDAVIACDDVPDLSDEARKRCLQFGTEFRDLTRLAEDVSLSSLLRTILDRSTVIAELDASPFPAALQAQAALTHLIGVARDFENGATLRGSQLRPFVDYLDVVRQIGDDAEDVPTVTQESVKVMTMHKAKGLQYDCVFVPGMAEGDFPSERGTNPMRDPREVPYPLREDAADLPDYSSPSFTEDLTDAKRMEERRLCYVAFTRARKRLVLSRAHFYRDNKKPQGPSSFWIEALETGIPVVGREDDVPDRNIVTDSEQVRPASSETSPVSRPIYPSLQTVGDQVARLSAEDRAVFDQGASSIRAEIERLATAERQLRVEVQPRPSGIQSVTALMTYEECPRLYYHEYVAPLPRAVHRAALVGLDLHRAIEDTLLGRDRPDRLPLDDTHDVHPSEHAGASPSADTMLGNFLTSRFNRPPHLIEQSFTLRFQNGHVRGRMDAVYATEASWELVDFKSGQPRTIEDVMTWLQLPLYALAANEIWGRKPDELTYTYYFLQTGEEIGTTVTADRLVAVRERTEGILTAIRAGQFDGKPGCRCPVCTWLETQYGLVSGP